MKKLSIIFAAVALLAACTQKEDVVPQLDENAIQFSAYSSASVVTRGVVVGTDALYGEATSKGIGVFAFYQPKATGKFNTYKYATPDFMYNQQVTADNTGDVWTYTPVKYWPNNTGDMVSFFAYAPYRSDKAWEDMGVKTDVKAKKLTTSFVINQDVVDQEDYLFATPQLNRTKQAVDANGNKYTTGTNNIKFDFKHITSQVNLYVGVEQNTASQQPTVWNDANTTIEVQSIEFKNLSSAINYCYDISSGSIGDLTTTQSKTKQNIILTEENFITGNNKSTAWTAAQSYPLNNANSILFLAPEKLGNVVITYTVTTIPTGTDVNDANASVVTNVITQDMSNVTLEAGKSYKLHFLIGMNNVKIVAKLTDWATPVIEKQADVPVNFGDYLCFEAMEAGSTVSMVNKNSAPDVSLVYSKDYYTWNDFIVGTTTVTLTNVGDKVYVKAKNPNNHFASNSDGDASKCNTFSLSGKVKVSGNIMYLLNGTNPPTNLSPGTNDYCFLRLFAYNNDKLSDVSELLLPAKELAKYCYTSMFLQCTAITTPTELPATTLAEGCYYSIFCHCNALTKGPELPAKTLAHKCYDSMFHTCGSLFTAPALPATLLANDCYRTMFKNCTSLTTAPVLPATTLVISCYQDIFNGCSALSSVTMLATDVSASFCLKDWLGNSTTSTQAGKDADSRTVTVANETVKSTVESTVSSFSKSWTVTVAP